MTPQEEVFLEQQQTQMELMQSQGNQMQTGAIQQSMYQDTKEKTMIQDQLDLSPELERIEHLLRGQVIVKDKQGNTTWEDSEDDRFRVLNEYGVHLIMNAISFYINKDTLLSNYSEETINTKMEDFSIDLADLIFMKYREMGLDTPDKRKMYPMLVRQIQDIVHSTYLRAYGGKERESLRRHMHVSESQGLNPTSQNNQGGGSRMNPMNWLRR